MRILVFTLTSFFLLNCADAQQTRLLAESGNKSAGGVVEKKGASRFWTPLTTGLVVADGASKAIDGYFTRYNVDHGGTEHDPLLRPFVHTPALHAGAEGALFAAEIATAHFMHRKGHPRLARALLLGGIALNGMGAQQSIRNR